MRQVYVLPIFGSVNPVDGDVLESQISFRGHDVRLSLWLDDITNPESGMADTLIFLSKLEPVLDSASDLMANGDLGDKWTEEIRDYFSHHLPDRTDLDSMRRTLYLESVAIYPDNDHYLAALDFQTSLVETQYLLCLRVGVSGTPRSLEMES